jgi:hypothetical protein
VREKMIYIILYDDGMLQVFAKEQIQKAYRRGTKCFMTSRFTTMGEFSEWVSGYYETALFEQEW